MFSASSVLPVPLLLAAVAFGGVWPWLALIYLTLFAFALDTLIGQMEVESEFPAAEGLSVALACLHFVVLGAVVWRFGQGVATAEAVGLFLATGLYIGQIGNSNAHELIHRGRRSLFGLGKAVYISLLFGHHVSAHPLVHHRHVATPRDPNTARLGEGYYRFLIRAWTGSFRAGFKAERARRKD
ncbi:MAG: fatty acid desaturase, partial [Pseudomonadota bacterium]